MVSPKVFPLIIYGKLVLPSRLPHEYRVLASHPGTCAALVRAIEEIPGGFGWSGASAAPHSPCFAFIRRAGHDVVLRLLDVDQDDTGRPHCFRMEAALVEDSALTADDHLLAGLLRPQAWPLQEVQIVNPAVVTLCADGQPDARLVKVIAAHRRGGVAPSILVGDQRSFTNSLFALVHDPLASSV